MYPVEVVFVEHALIGCVKVPQYRLNGCQTPIPLAAELLNLRLFAKQHRVDCSGVHKHALIDRQRCRVECSVTRLFSTTNGKHAL